MKIEKTFSANVSCGVNIVVGIFLQFVKTALLTDPSNIQNEAPESVHGNVPSLPDQANAWPYLCGQKRVSVFSETSGCCAFPNFKYAHRSERDLQFDR